MFRAFSVVCTSDNFFIVGVVLWYLVLSLEKRRLRGKNIECFKIFKRFSNVDASKMCPIDNKP